MTNSSSSEDVRHDAGGWISGPMLDAPAAGLLAAHGETWTVEASAGMWTASSQSDDGSRRRFVVAHSAAELHAKLDSIESETP